MSFNLFLFLTLETKWKVRVAVAVVSLGLDNVALWLENQFISHRKEPSLGFLEGHWIPQVQSHVTGLWWDPALWVSGNLNRAIPSGFLALSWSCELLQEVAREFRWHREAEALIPQPSHWQCYWDSIYRFCLKEPSIHMVFGGKKGLFGDSLISILLCQCW